MPVTAQTWQTTFVEERASFEGETHFTTEKYNSSLSVNRLACSGNGLEPGQFFTIATKLSIELNSLSGSRVTWFQY
ncbi:1276_t:CDS:2 [Paraglomus occultum]|uniref:1276_t:CDS:1 n=1 Tax=Paraglomus occultum TaxID=144539 RepID=A0A9N9CR73_9GLOM|nr:1276_t:CDS:2 [Paraglomus occultum]